MSCSAFRLGTIDRNFQSLTMYIHRRMPRISRPVLLLGVTLGTVITFILVNLGDELILSDQIPSESIQSVCVRSAENGDHSQEVPSYYPMKTKGLFTQYILLDDKCTFELKRRSDLDNATTATLEEEQMRKFSTTDMLSESSPISMDFDGMKCEKLMTLHHNILWRMSFDILVDLNELDDVIKEFEVFQTSTKASGGEEIQETRSAGRVHDGEVITGADGKLHRKYRGMFAVFTYSQNEIRTLIACSARAYSIFIFPVFFQPIFSYSIHCGCTKSRSTTVIRTNGSITRTMGIPISSITLNENGLSDKNVVKRPRILKYSRP